VPNPVRTSISDQIDKLKKKGVLVFYKNNKQSFGEMNWNCLGGYESQKRDIEDTILMTLKYPGKVHNTKRFITK
jgi:hypothetical protein